MWGPDFPSIVTWLRCWWAETRRWWWQEGIIGKYCPGEEIVCVWKRSAWPFYFQVTLIFERQFKSSIAESSFVVAEIYTMACLNLFSLKVKKIEKCSSLEEISKLLLWKAIQYFNLEIEKFLNKKQLLHEISKYKCQLWKKNEKLSLKMFFLKIIYL